MPPIQPSFRASLLTGVSAVALSVASSGQAAAQNTPPTLTLWGEGAAFWTGGGRYNIPWLLGSSYTSLKPLVGFEGAVGLDYRWPNQIWHFVFDFRYGKTRTASNNAAAFQTFGTTFGYLLTSATSNQSTEHESHLVADFMIGRDLGVGGNTPELEFGIRIADLHAAAQMVESSQRTFYTPTTIVTTARSSLDNWNSRFFGVGPRLAIVGGYSDRRRVVVRVRRGHCRLARRAETRGVEQHRIRRQQPRHGIRVQRGRLAGIELSDHLAVQDQHRHSRRFLQ